MTNDTALVLEIPSNLKLGESYRFVLEDDFNFPIERDIPLINSETQETIGKARLLEVRRDGLENKRYTSGEYQVTKLDSRRR